MDTLKVKMNVSIVAADWSFYPDEEVELDKPLADTWLESGHASAIEGEKVNKVKLAEGVEYLGFGLFVVNGHRVYGKNAANELVK